MRADLKYYMNGIRGTSKDEHADNNTKDPSKMAFFIIYSPIDTQMITVVLGLRQPLSVKSKN